MKQLILLFAVIVAIARFGHSQVEITKLGNTTVLNGTQLVHVVTSNGDSNIELLFKNIGTTDKSWKITRKHLTVIPSNWEDYICWGIEGEAGQCYSSSAAINWTTPDPLTIFDSQFNPVSGLPVGQSGSAAIHYVAQNCGTATYRYYVHEEGGAYLDSVDVRVIFSCASIDEKEPVSISVYPNPVSSVLTINAEGLDKFDIRIVDVLGKIIYDETATKTKKVDVSELKNGVYIVSIIEKGVAIQTKRIVIKH